MKQDRIIGFETAFKKSVKHNIDFAIIAPNTLEEVQKSDIDLKSKAFIDFHIAIRPNTPVVLFDIENTIEAGSPVWNIDKDKKLYHLPESTYPYLDEFVLETAFLLTQNIVIHILNKSKVHSGIFGVLAEIRKETGLTVLGLYDENTETEV